MAMGIEGLTTVKELEFLYDTILNEVPIIGLVVELGTFKGRSTAAICGAVVDRPGHLFVIGIDHFKMQHHGKNDLWTTHNNLAALGYFPGLMRAESTKPQPSIKQVSALIIDTDHKASVLNKELDEWLPKIVDGGVIILHDYGSAKWPEITDVVDQRLTNSSDWELLGLAGMMVAFRKL